MEELVLDGINGRTLVIRKMDDGAASSGGPADYRVTLTLPEFAVDIDMWERISFLACFLREVAEAWQGFVGVKEYESTEHELHMACRHDGTGRVECLVTLRRTWSPEWTFEAEIDFGAGAHLERIANDATELVPRIRS